MLCLIGGCIVAIPALAYGIAQTEQVAYFEALYSTILTAILIGPSLDVTSGGGRTIVILTVIVGLILIETSLALVVSLVHSRMERAEIFAAIDEAIRERQTQPAVSVQTRPLDQVKSGAGDNDEEAGV